MGTRKSIRPVTRGTAAFMAIMAVLQVRSATGAPGDIFTIPAPVIGSDPPKAADIKDGDASVSTQTGALTYSYPIEVPPGRNGMAPQLALSYSSQAPIYGGIAAGWSLSIPTISEDLSLGRMKTRSGLLELNQVLTGQDYRADDRFVSSLAGGRPLVKVAEPVGANADVYATYRAQNDTTFARYERMKPTAPYRWRVLTTDGKTLTFGDNSLMAECGGATDQFAPLTRMVDQFGNEVRYQYILKNTDECVLHFVVWGQNGNASLADFARVDLTYTNGSVCNGVRTNSQTDYRSGARVVTGASMLDTITVTANPPGSPAHMRKIKLSYDRQAETCSEQHAPVRLLTSIQESAGDPSSTLLTLPAVTFEYNTPRTTLVTPQVLPAVPWPYGPDGLPHLGWGYRGSELKWPTVESMFLDIDGDGLLDLLMNDSGAAPTTCKAKWLKGKIDQNGNLNFAVPLATDGYQETITLPRLKWKGTPRPWPVAGAAQADPESKEGCALNGQATAFRNSFNPGPLVPHASVCHEPAGAACRNATDPKNVNKYCGTGGTVCPADDGGPHNPQAEDFVTQLAYRWLDVDSDGLVDLVTAVHGDVDWYDIERGNMKPNPKNRNDYSGGEPPMYGMPGLNGWPACSGQRSNFLDLGECLNPENVRVCSGASCITDWAKVLNCVTASLVTGSAVVFQKPSGGPAGAPGMGDKRVPYERCEGLYPWFIYKNQGQGVFASTPIIKYQPVPLESVNGDSSVSNALTVSSENHTIMDFDGDGYLDAVVRPTNGDGTVATGTSAWQVWFGDGTGGFGPQVFVFMTRRMTPCTKGSTCFGQDAIGASGGQWGNQTISTAGLIDANGDGAQDHWLGFTLPPSGYPDIANIAFNDGEQLKLVGAYPGTGEVTTSIVGGFRVKPGNDSWVHSTNPSCPQPGPGVPPCPSWGSPIHAGSTYALTRIVDVDGDGRVDIVSFPTNPSPPTNPRVFFNAGGSFITPGVEYPSWMTVGIRREAEAIGDGRWRLNNDLMDLDGDGIQEAVSFYGNQLVWARPQNTQPPRLLRALHNGRGLHSTITYAQMHDQSTVVQDTKLKWPDGRPKASPRTQWVVKSLRVTDDVSATDGTTQYLYKHPRHGADDGRYSFRGFEEVTTTAPGPTGAANGSQTIQTYGYDPDWSGRLVKTVVKKSAAEGGAAHTVDTTTWRQLTLFSGALKTYHADVSTHYVCSNGQTDSECTSAPAGRTKTTRTWTAYPTTATTTDDQLWAESGSLLQAGTSASDGDRQVLTTYELDSDKSRYRFREYQVEKQHRLASVMVPFAKFRKTWDPMYGTQLTDEVWVDSVDANRAITRYEYDNGTGNRTKVWKPVQWAANPNTLTNLNRTTLGYDNIKLFVASETNELGHTQSHTYEYGMGIKLQTLGPNKPTCAQTSSCPTGQPLTEVQKIRVDGFGRTIERYATVGDNQLYYLIKVETNAYVDGPSSSVTHQAAFDFEASSLNVRYTRDTTNLDGHGRPTRKTIDVFGTAPANQITTYQYSRDGNLSSVTVPDPTANSSATVTYTYAFDSLGRPTGIRRPDSTSASSQSGVNISYAGMTTTTDEFVGAAGGQAASTITRNDAFGRLVEVQEKRTSSTWAKTSYAYDPNDNIKQITDPQNGITALTHDYASRRTVITRASRTWKYTYDRNGNLTVEQAPCTPAPACEPNYKTSIAYDVLDRVSSKMLAPRALTSADRTLFGATSEVFTYDTAQNGVGRLGRWESFGPGAVPATLSNTWDYNAQGMTQSIYETARVADYPTLSRNFSTFFNVAGNPVSTFYRDIVGTQNCQSGSHGYYQYDARGLPLSVQLNACLYDAAPPWSVLVNERNVAGLVTRRYAVAGSGPFTNIDNTWTYDKLGRVESQTIKKGAPLAQVAKQQLSYFGNDDPKTLDHWLGATNQKRFNFTYDHRHQLTNVTESMLPNAFTATYAYGAAGRFTSANVAAASLLSSDVKARNVTYEYAGIDPEQVTKLKKTNNATYASYAYDAPGNRTSLDYPDTKERWDYTYDGRNQLRRVTKKLNNVVQGSEEYWYDEKGAREIVLKRNASGAKTEMIWFIGDTEAHYNAAGTPTQVYAHVSLGTPIARLERTPGGPSVEYQFHGLSNNTLAAIDQATGTVNASFMYAPFGEIVEGTDAGGGAAGIAKHRRRMNDKYVDELSDLAYYGFRYYDKRSMTWTQSDPLYRFAPDAAWDTPRHANLYTMTLNNPLRYIDPDGRETLTMGGFFVAVAEKTAEAVGLSTLGTVGVIASVAVGLAAAAYAASLAAPDSPGISVKHEAAYDRAQYNKLVEKQRDEANASQSTSDAIEGQLSKEEPSIDVKSGGPMGTPKPVQAAPRGGGNAVAGTGKKAGNAYPAKVRPGQPGPPKKLSTKPRKKSDAVKETKKQGQWGGTIGSKTQGKQMGGRTDDGHQGGPPHTHAPVGEGTGHWWFNF